jgi:lysophospholipase L1-like esterase
MPRADRRPRLVAALVLALTGGLAGCSDTADGAGSPAEATSSTPEIATYVALGDSFTAAPFVPATAFADGCLRSSGNYPGLVADELDARLRDVSCSGAATADMTAPQAAAGREDWYGKVPPQLDAVRRGTDLVTVGIGGNDEQLFQTLVQTCTAVADQPGAPCTELLRSSYGDATEVLDAVGRRVADVLSAVRRKAPDATVVLVGYPRLVDAQQACPAMPLADGDLPLVARLEARLNRTLAGAARTSGAEFVDMRAVSEGHEICSDDPWVNGKDTDQQRALAFHPFAEGEQAVADQILALLSR